MHFIIADRFATDIHRNSDYLISHRHTQTYTDKSFPRATLPEEKLYAMRATKFNQSHKINLTHLYSNRGAVDRFGSARANAGWSNKS
jgi:hypothetical protein